MTYVPFRYVTFKPLTNAHLPLVKEWISSEKAHEKQNSSVCFDVLNDQSDLLISGLIEIDGQKKPLKPYVMYDNEDPCGYFHFYQTTETPNQGAALAIHFNGPLSEDMGKEATFIELFLDNYIYPEYEFCIVDIDTTNTTFINLFHNLGFTIHTRLNDFLIMVKQA